MSIGIIYLRPIAVARIRGFGLHREAASEAWSRMLSWLDDRKYRVEAARGFGMVHKLQHHGTDQKEATYEACVELFDGLKVEYDAGIDTAYVPGGAYLRRRHRGPIGELGDALRQMRTEEVSRRGLAFDVWRPMIEVYLNDFKRTGEPPKIDLCVPVMA